MRDHAVENVTADAASEKAMSSFRLLRPVLEDGVSIIALANGSGVSVRTLRRWVRLYRKHGLAGLQRRSRNDRGRYRRIPVGLVSLVEGLALERPRRPIATIHRLVCAAAEREGWTAPSYSTFPNAMTIQASPLMYHRTHRNAA